MLGFRAEDAVNVKVSALKSPTWNCVIAGWCLRGTWSKLK
jgi:hypothetical protein